MKSKILYLSYPALLPFLMLLLPNIGNILLYVISILGIVLYFIYKPCEFNYLIGGALIMPISIIPCGIIENIRNYGIDNALIEIEWAPLIIVIWWGIYTLPYILISVIFYAIINKFKI